MEFETLKLAVEGKVEKQVKGGYEIRIARERAFCPLSQIDIARTADTSAFPARSASRAAPSCPRGVCASASAAALR